MRTNIKATGLELTSGITDHINNKLAMLDKLLARYSDVLAEVEVGKETNHHKNGNWFFAEINLKLNGKVLRHTIDDVDLYAAIDKAKDGLAEELRSYEKKQNTLFKRGGRALKNLFSRSTAV